MRRYFVFSFVALGLLAGCGPQTVAGGAPTGSPSSSPSVSTSPSPSPSAESPSSSPSIGLPTTRPSKPATSPVPVPTDGIKVLPELSPVGNDSVAWTFDKTGPESTDIIASVATGPCHKLIGAHVTLTDTTATVAVLAAPPPQGMCPLVEYTAVVLIRASEPLGARRIVHAHLGR